MKVREVAKNIALLLVSCVVFFIVAEGGFKILHIFSDAEVSPTDIEGLPYENTPNGWFVRYEPSNGWIMYKNNSLGMRDVERTFDKKEGVKRVVCLGDSIMFGGEVAFDQIFSRQLEGMLNETYTSKVEVLNCGTTSYSMREYLIYLKKKALKFDPDLVVVGLCLNDYKSLFEPKGSDAVAACGGGPKKMWWGKYVPKIKRFLFHSYFLEYLNKSWKTLAPYKRKDVKEEWFEAVDQNAWMGSKEYFIQIKEICDTHGLGMLVVIFPYGEQLKDRSTEKQPQISIRPILNDLNIDYVDLLPVYMNYTLQEEEIFSRFDPVHPLPSGHKIAANEAKEVIKRKNLLNIEE